MKKAAILQKKIMEEKLREYSVMTQLQNLVLWMKKRSGITPTCLANPQLKQVLLLRQYASRSSSKIYHMLVVSFLREFVLKICNMYTVNTFLGKC